ncbi:hypothetical protein MBLNU459_g8125t1 [Dothideomycetes sp. NU459]
MASDAGLQPELATSDRINEDAQPAATEPSDDLFGDDPAEQVTEVKPVAAGEHSSEVVAPVTLPTSPASNSQPSSGAQPVTDTSSGIAPVADFIPSDAKLDQPTPSPLELLATGEARLDDDTGMTDAPSLLTDAAEAPASDLPKEETQQPTSAPQIDETETSLDDASIKADPASHQPQTNGTMTEPEVAAPTSSVSSAAVQADTPSSGVVRARDEDDTTSEPSAKRTKTENALANDAQAEFKKPDAPAVSAPVAAPVATNGNGAHLPKTPSFSSSPLTLAQKSILLDKMKNTKKVKSAFWFLKPVDYVALNIPHYPTVIKTPMDLSTMERKLKDGQYSSIDSFVADFELIVSNCITFNGAQHAASFAAQSLRAYFMKQMETVPTGEAAVQSQKPAKKAAAPPVAKTANVSARRESRTAAVPGAARSPVAAETFALLPGGTPMIRRDSTAAGRPKRAVIPPAPRDLPYATSKPKRKESQMGLKFCEHIVEEFRKPKYDRFAGAFRIPVDPVALNIPMYFSIIKHPMDLSTMTNKLKSGQYSTAAEFKADGDLMFSNCFKFNPPDNVVHQMGKEFQREFDIQWAKKDAWIKKNTPQSQRASSASDVGSDGDDSDEDNDDDAETDNNEATILALRQQLEEMQNMLGSISGAKRASPGGKSNKKKGKSSKPSKKGGLPAPSRTTIKAKPKKQRLVTYEEKQEISNATEKMDGDQVEKLTQIITENVSKYKDMPGDDVELEIDDLPNEVQHKLLKYVRTIFPPRVPTDDGNAVDDDYEPERPSNRGGAAKKKHKPMKKHEQESRIAQLKQQMAQMSGAALPNASAIPAPQSSSDEDSESSEEE